MKKLLLSFVALVATVTAMAQVSFIIFPPSANAGGYPLTYADDLGGDWSVPDPLDPNNAVEDTLVIYRDTLACTPATNAQDIDGQIAVVWRTDCQFGVKAFNAQNAGARAVVIVNNNGAPVGMAGGTDGLNVTIPVVMVSTSTGNLIHDEITNGGTVTAFIGNKTGYYQNDLGIYPKDVLRPRQFALPVDLAADDTEFSVPLGAWIFNYGVNDQTNIILSGTVTAGGSTLYNESATAIPSLLSGDSIYVALPLYSSPTYSQDYYEIEYSVRYDVADDFDFDNNLNADFMLTEDEFAYAQVDQATVQPIARQYTQSGAFTQSWGNCIHFTNPNASRKAALGLTFYAAANDPDGSLLNEFVTFEVFEWTDSYYRFQ